MKIETADTIKNGIIDYTTLCKVGQRWAKWGRWIDQYYRPYYEGSKVGCLSEYRD